MTYYERQKELAETTLELVERGFCVCCAEIGINLSVIGANNSTKATDASETLAKYINALRDARDKVQYYDEQIKKEKENEE